MLVHMRAILTYHLPPTTAYLLRVEGNRRFNIQTIPRLTAQLSWKWKHVAVAVAVFFDGHSIDNSRRTFPRRRVSGLASA